MREWLRGSWAFLAGLVILSGGVATWFILTSGPAGIPGELTVSRCVSVSTAEWACAGAFRADQGPRAVPSVQLTGIAYYPPGVRVRVLYTSGDEVTLRHAEEDPDATHRWQEVIGGAIAAGLIGGLRPYVRRSLAKRRPRASGS